MRQTNGPAGLRLHRAHSLERIVFFVSTDHVRESFYDELFFRGSMDGT